VTMISRGVEISIAEVEERWFLALSLGCFFSFSFFFFLSSCLICFRYKKPYPLSWSFFSSFFFFCNHG